MITFKEILLQERHKEHLFSIIDFFASMKKTLPVITIEFSQGMEKKLNLTNEAIEKIKRIIDDMHLYDILHSENSKSVLAKDYIDLLELLNIRYHIKGGLGKESTSNGSTNAEFAHKQGLYTAEELSKYLHIPKQLIIQNCKTKAQHHINRELVSFYSSSEAKALAQYSKQV